MELIWRGKARYVEKHLQAVQRPGRMCWPGNSGEAAVLIAGQQAVLQGILFAPSSSGDMPRYIFCQSTVGIVLFFCHSNKLVKFLELHGFH